MKKLVLLTFATALALPGVALAQPEVEPTPDPAYEPAPQPEPAYEPAPVQPEPEPAPVVEEVAAEEPAEEEPWYDDLSFGVFTDAYYLADWNMPEDPTSWSGYPHRAYDLSNGFGLAFAGIDLKYAGESVGATISLRYGNGGQRLVGSAEPVLAPLWQAYGTWSPTDSLTLDLGQFGTIYGAEVAESWMNLNYSRGAVYYLMQPFYHVGLRATYAASDMLTLKLLVVNGTNNFAGPLGFGEDGNHTPHLGGQVGFTPSDGIALYLGYYTGANASGFGPAADTDDGDWEHFVDFVGVFAFGDLTLITNVDFYALPEFDALYWGASAALGYSLTEKFGLAARVEFLHNPDDFLGFDPDVGAALYEWLVTGTVTADYRPLDSLTLRLETRLEVADDEIYVAREELRSTGLTSTLSAVVHYGI